MPSTPKDKKFALQDRHLWQLFLALNVALVTGLLLVVVSSRQNLPKTIVTRFPAGAPAAPTNPVEAGLPPRAPSETVATSAASNTPVVPPRPLASTSEPARIPAGTSSAPDAVALAPAARKYDWQLVESPEYRVYLDRLRAAGCPEPQVERIALSDINDLFDKRRLKEAIANDIAWWKVLPELLVANTLEEKGRQLEEDRHGLIDRLLGADVLARERREPMLWRNVPLTGPILGALPMKEHTELQEISARALDRQNSARWARIGQGVGPDTLQMARMREDTRTELARVLNPEALEEFLLRYSHNATALREELRALNPSPDEFRKVFRAVDPLDHQVQSTIGDPGALSPAQRERHEREREDAIKRSLEPDRFQAYLLTKDPLYRQAQMTAQQYGAPLKAVLPLYQLTRASEAKRQQILANKSLTPDQANTALLGVNEEQQQGVQRILSESQQR